MKTSDVKIYRAFEVHCPQHGSVDAAPTYELALSARRAHLEADHPEWKGASRAQS